LNPSGGPGPVSQSAQTYQSVLVGAGGAQVESVLRADARMPICVALYDCEPYDLWVPSLLVARLTVTLSPSPLKGYVDGTRPRHYMMQKHALFLTPAGADARWLKPEPSRHINLYFHADTLAADPEGANTSYKERPLINLTLPGVAPMAASLAAELARPDVFSPEAVDSLARLLLVRLMRFAPGASPHKSPLQPSHLVRIRDYIQAHISEQILVADLAPLTGLSPFRFAHVFSELTGRSPHQYVLCLRLACALNLLRSSDMGLAEVALASGFGSQQHLTHVMQRRLRITPGRYRAKAQGGAL
jgi:AraC family transcriptional regulator